MTIANKLKVFLQQCARVWAVLKKPSKEEFRSIAKVSAIGLLALGAFGFLLAFIVNLF